MKPRGILSQSFDKALVSKSRSSRNIQSILNKSALSLLCLAALHACLPAPPLESVNHPPVYDRRAGNVALQDEQLEIQARQMLNEQSELFGRVHVNFNAYNASLLVTGEAIDEASHQQIIENVRAIDGVQRVLDEMQIAPPTDPASQYNDSVISGRIMVELDKIAGIQPDFKSQNVKLVVENGIVYLMGMVYRQEADRIVRAAQDVSGVVKIIKMFEYLP